MRQSSSVQAAGPDAKQLAERRILSEYAKAHDALDRFGIPRNLRGHDEHGRIVMYDLPTRVALLAERAALLLSRESEGEAER